MWNRAINRGTPRLIDVNRPASEAVPNDPDSDFDDDPLPLPPKKRTKKTSESSAYKPKPVPRIIACGVKNLDRTVLEVRAHNPNGFFVLCLLSESLEHHAAVQNCVPDDQFVAQTRDGTPFRLHPDEDELDESEFMGLFASGPYDRADPGVCDAIITWLEADERYSVIVVDPSERGFNFARLAARVAMLKWTMTHKVEIARDLASGIRLPALPAPTDAKWKAALERCKRGQSWAAVREHARDWFLSL